MDEEETQQQLQFSCRFKSENGETTGGVLQLPANCTTQQLSVICNSLLEHEEPLPFLFYINETEIKKNLANTLEALQIFNQEGVVDIVYQEQAEFRVPPVTRCTSSMPGHTQAVVSVSFSPDGQRLASCSGDTTVRLWNVSTQTLFKTCKGHTNWVLCIAWSPNGKKLASACKDGKVIIWDIFSGMQRGETMNGHKQHVTSLSWEPYHQNDKCRFLASSSADGDIRIWDTDLCRTVFTLFDHTRSVKMVKWGGSDLLYSASLDHTVKVWRASDGSHRRTLDGHSRLINTLALNTDYILRIGAFDPVENPTQENSQKFARTRYNKVVEAAGGEHLVSGSDDFTMLLWNPGKQRKYLARLTGHQQMVIDVKFSPDGSILASTSFDKSIKIWEPRTGECIMTLRGHVQSVYTMAFSVDSRLLVSGSADSTLKLWNLKTGKLQVDLPGHADEVFAVDWSTDGARVASGGKDKVLKLWHN